MVARMNFRIITKNSAADPEIGLYVLVRAFFEELKEMRVRLEAQYDRELNR